MYATANLAKWAPAVTLTNALICLFMASTILAALAVFGVSIFELPLNQSAATGAAIQLAITEPTTCQTVCRNFFNYICVERDDLTFYNVGTSPYLIQETLPNCDVATQINNGGTLVCVCTPNQDG